MKLLYVIVLSVLFLSACKKQKILIDDLPHVMVSFNKLPNDVRAAYEQNVGKSDTFRVICLCIDCSDECVVNRTSIDKSIGELLKKGFVYEFFIGEKVYALKANKGSPFVFYQSKFYYPVELNLSTENYKDVLYNVVSIE